MNAPLNKLSRLFAAIGLLVSLTVLVHAQDIHRYRFIKTQYNRLYFAPDSSSFDSFFRKLNSVREGKNETVRIVHIGGSHVQGGVWSNTFLSEFQKAFVTAGGGYFAFPYRIGKTNGQPYATSFSSGRWKLCRATGRDYCLPLGMCALSITSNDSACYFGMELTQKSACRYVNRLRVYHNFNGSFVFSPALSDSLKVSRSEYPAQGYSEFTFAMPVDSVCFNLVKKNTLNRDFTLYGFSFENDMAPGFYLAGLGANGAFSNSFLRCVQLEPQLASLHGDIFILSLGVNDTQSKGFSNEEYIENYDSLITLIKKVSPDAAILLTTTTDNYIRRRTSNKRPVKAREAMFMLMEKHKVAVWDMYTVMGGYRSILMWYKAGMASRDRVHFTSRGYTLLGELMYEAVNRSYENFNKK